MSKQTEICDNNLAFNYSQNIPFANPSKIINKLIEFRLFEKGFFSNSEIGQVSIKLEGLRNESKQEGSIKFMGKKNTEIELEYGLYLREPFDKLTTKQVTFFNLLK